jgi:single-stranded-DNA-specific exonuclease
LQHALEPKSKILSDLKEAGDNLKIFSDLGSSLLDTIEGYKGYSIILDHHKPTRDSVADNVIHINSNLFDINGSYEISASTLAFLLSVRITRRNWDLISVALAGAIGDKQHKNGFNGLNLELLETGLDLGIIKAKTSIKLTGNTILETLIRSTDPYFVGLTNNEPGVRKLLSELAVDPQATLGSLEKNTVQRLASYLTLMLLEQGIPPEDAEEIITTKYFDTNLNLEIEELSHMINSCGRMGEMGVGVAAGLGDQQAMARAKELRAEYKNKVLAGLKILDKDRPKELEHIQYFYESKAEFAGTFAGIGMMYFFNQIKPVLALTKADDDLKVSGRGTKRLVQQGLDLAGALAEVSAELGGSGGGHPIAAGATIPSGKDQEFLEKMDKLVGEQLSNEK